MFTGIVENTGRIKNLSRKVDTYRLEVLAEQKLNSVKIGDSVSVNGTCLSVVGTSGKTISFDIMAETFKKTSFPRLKNNNIVNLERSLELNSRLDGHFVSGHVDSVQKIKEIRRSIKSYKEDLRIELTKSKTDDKKIDSIMTEITALKKSALKSRVNSIKNLQKILKPEQKKKMKKHLILYKKMHDSNE